MSQSIIQSNVEFFYFLEEERDITFCGVTGACHCCSVTKYVARINEGDGKGIRWKGGEERKKKVQIG